MWKRTGKLSRSVTAASAPVLCLLCAIYVFDLLLINSSVKCALEESRKVSVQGFQLAWHFDSKWKGELHPSWDVSFLYEQHAQGSCCLAAVKPQGFCSGVL